MDGDERGDGMTRLVIIRHGEAQCAVDSLVGGPKGCTGLSDEGRHQCELLRDRLLRTGELDDTDVVLTSVLPRAIETAQIIAPALGPAAEIEAKQDCDLCELHPGEADGLTWDEYRTRYADTDMRANPYAPIAPGGESIAEFLLRVGRTLTRIVIDHSDQTVVIAAHGGVVWGSMRAFMDLPMRSAFLEAQNTSLTEWQIDSAAGVTKLVRFNDAAHLTLAYWPNRRCETSSYDVSHRQLAGFYRCRPHSILSSPAHRPARGSSPSDTGLVHGMQPIDG
jgi:probable phosphoglycerate mutase